MDLYYNGNKNLRKCEPCVIPTNDQFQLWHHNQFQMASEGVELLFPYKATSFKKKCVKPFLALSDMYYSLTLDFTLKSSSRLMILPHNSYYCKEEVPLVVPYVWEEWWSLPLTIIFKYAGKVAFETGKPFAQIISVGKQDINICEMSEKQKEKNMQSCKFILENKDKYATREDNVYNVLSLLNKEFKLPKELKDNDHKLRLFKNAKMVQNQ